MIAESEEELKNLVMEGERGACKKWSEAQHQKKLRSWPLVPSPPGK